MTDNPTLELAIDAYLKKRKSTLWGRAYDLSDPLSFAEAHEFIAETLWGVLAEQ